MQIDPQVEALARAMCISVGSLPDKLFSHGYNWKIYPTIDYDDFSSTIDIIMYSPNWHRYAWAARKWIFENSGGQFGG